MKTLTCVCGQEKPLNEFYRDRTQESGYRSQCIACTVESFHRVEPSGKRRRSTLSRLMPVLRRMSRDEGASAKAWFEDLVEILPPELRKEFQ